MAGYSYNTNIKTPSDNDILYRYMDFYKFVSLVSKKELFFCKANRFEDPLECCYPKDYYASGNSFNRIFQREGAKHGYIDSEIEKIKERVQEAQTIKNKIGVISFCSKDYEYDSLWKLYSNTKTGICLVTSAGKLKASIAQTTYTGPIYIGKVNYRDYEREFIGVSNKFAPIFTKRKEFENEHEVRAIIVKDDNHQTDEIESGYRIPVDTKMLIEEIILSPSSDESLFVLVKSLLEKNDIDPNNVRVRKSELYTRIE